ncbi:hypothetical protein [Kamptonema sp. UHCC 0994]|uniref:hypothetical protein n=1 Tax=Kamptonema sp. UHCC 0994 TaxID=3031329 RepID=UPI0023B985F9|nr:hypothetical protein [Kamptonema sp. UHCC 0994]MDF0555905.1 hypothetical protein [Kamptonema sp. UHCC 0994]
MYEPIQHFLTLTIETVVILGYGGLIVHYIATLSTSKQMNLAEKQEAEITPKFVPILNEITSFPAVAECAATQELTAEQGLTSSLQVKAELASNIQLDTDPLNLPFIQVDSLTLRQCRTVIRAINSTLPKSDRLSLKLNKKDAPIDWLKTQIKKQLENHPQLFSSLNLDNLES